MTVAEHWLVCPDETVEGEHVTVTEVMLDCGFTMTVIVPRFVLSWVEVAVIATASDKFPELGAENRPELEIEPALADHVTPELKLPVPVTEAEH